jgi:hypothetical protein
VDTVRDGYGTPGIGTDVRELAMIVAGLERLRRGGRVTVDRHRQFVLACVIELRQGAV